MQALATKWRPKSFEDVCSQTSIIKILQRQLELKQFKNTYLFCGPSGCGKTTLARIFANSINNFIGTPIEIDAASNNGVDNVKEIIKSATERSIDSEYKIYIIDECHSLTNQAWQAFLKCIEEPPKYTIFLFCTTDPQKIPATIVNRCMRFNFTRIGSTDIKNRLSIICESEGFVNYDSCIDYISKTCKGQMRDAISNLEKVAAFSNDLSIENVLEVLGNYSYSTYIDLTNSIIDGNEKELFKIVDSCYKSGSDMKRFIDNYLTFLLDVAKYNIFHTCDILQIPREFEDKLKMLINFNDAGKYYRYLINNILDLKNMLKTDTSAKDTIEVVLMKLANCM